MREFVFNKIHEYTGITPELIVFFLGLVVLYINYISAHAFLFTSIIITTFALALYDVFLKKILLFAVDNDYYRFIINNIIIFLI